MITFGETSGTSGLAVIGAAAAIVVVTVAGIVVHASR